MTTKDRKEREKMARKKAIVDAAREVFFKNGFQATTMDQIAEIAELSKGSLYLHFPTKEELYVTILIEGLEMLCRRFEQAVAGVKDWETQIRNIGSAYYTFYYEEKNYFQILFLLQHGEIAPKISDELREICFEKGLSCLNILCRAIEMGIGKGEIQDQNAMELAVILWGALNGIFLLYEEEDYNQIISAPLDKIIQTSIVLLINGLRKR